MNGRMLRAISAPRHVAESWSLSLAMLLALLCVCGTSRASDQTAPRDSDTEPFRIGFMQAIFKNQNEADVLAAMKVWAVTIGKERGIEIDEQIVVYQSLAAAERALRDKKVDALTMLIDEYTGLPPDLISGPFFRDEANGSARREFVVLSRADRDVGALAGLRGAKLGVHDDKYVGLASSWLNAQLAGAGLESFKESSAAVEYNDKLSAVVLGVFFGKYDAALVSRRGFTAMAALNPQVEAQLRIVIAAPPIIASVFCFRSELDNVRKERFLREVLRLHESVAGEQVLRVFKSDRMVELDGEDVRRSVALLAQWRAANAEEGIMENMQALKVEERE